MLKELKGTVKPRNSDYIDKKLSELGAGRVMSAQLLVLESEFASILPPEYYLAVGIRESGLRNLNNPVDSDKGWLQISEAYHLSWLRSQPGCPETKNTGLMDPAQWRAIEKKNAAMDDYCPRFTPALDYAMHEITAVGLRVASNRKIPKKSRLHYATTFYNTGDGLALRGYKEGNIDKYSTGGDYGGTVITASRIFINVSFFVSS